MACIPRGPSIPCHPWLVYNNLRPWLYLHPNHPFRPSNTKSSQKHLILLNIDHISVGSMLTPSGIPSRHTTQWGASIVIFPMKKHLESRNPALNVPKRCEADATDTVYSDTPAVDSGVKQAQLFIGNDRIPAKKSLV